MPTLEPSAFLAANLIAEPGGKFEIQRTNNFTLTISPPSGFTVPASTSESNPNEPVRGAPTQVPGDIGALIRMSLKAFPFPVETSTKIEIPYENSERKVAGIVKYADVDMVLHDYFDSEVVLLLTKWRRLIWVPYGAPALARIGNLANEAVGYARSYKSQGQLILHGPGGEAVTQRLWNLKGLWPISLEMGKGDYSQNGKNEVTVKFCIDYIVEEKLDGKIPGT
jgi:hypothetical protein